MKYSNSTSHYISFYLLIIFVIDISFLKVYDTTGVNLLIMFLLDCTVFFLGYSLFMRESITIDKKRGVVLIEENNLLKKKPIVEILFENLKVVLAKRANVRGGKREVLVLFKNNVECFVVEPSYGWSKDSIFELYEDLLSVVRH